MKKVFVHPQVKSQKLRELLEQWGCLCEQEEQADFLAIKDSVEFDENRDLFLVIEEEGDGDRLFFDLGGENKIQSLLYIDSIEDPHYQKALRSMLEGSSLGFEDVFKEGATKNFKVSEHLSIGYYTDIVASEALGSNLNILRLRKYLFDLFTFLSYLNKGDVAYLPFEVEFAVDEKNVFVKVHAHVQNFVRDYLWGTIERKNDTIQFHELLSELSHESDILDIHYLKSTSKLVFSALWSEDIARCAALFLHSIQSYGERQELHLRPQVQLEKSLTHQSTESLPDEPIRVMGGGEDNSSNVVRLRRVVTFSEDQIGNPEEFDREKLEEILDNYPDGSVPPELSEEEKNYIVDCIRNESERKRLEDSYDRLTSSIEEDDFVERVKSQVGEADFGEVEEILVRGNPEDLGEESTKVAGQKEDLTDEAQKVAGTKEDLGEESQVVSGPKEDDSEKAQTIKGEREDLGEEVQKVSGSENSDLTQEKWELHRTGLQEFLDERAEWVRENPDYKKEDLEKEFRDKVKETLGVDEEKASGLSSHFIDQALTQGAEDKIAEQGEKKESIGLRQDNEKLSNENEKLKDHNERLLKLVSSMKDKIQMMHEVDQLVDDEDEEEDDGLSLEEAYEKIEQLKKRSEFLKKSADSSFSTLKRFKESQARLKEVKEKEVERLTKERDELKQKLDHAPVEEYKRKAQSLEEEKESLESKLSMANERLSSMSGNLEKRLKDMEKRHHQETNRLNGLCSESYKQLKEMKDEKEKAEEELKSRDQELAKLKEAFASLKENLGSEQGEKQQDEAVANSDQTIKDLQQQLAAEKDKLRASGLKMKQYEQKIRFLNAQLENLQKNQNGGQQGNTQNGVGGAQAPNAKQLEYQVKQLNNSNTRLEQSLKKTNEDLAEKKKETHKLNQELNGAKAKIAELERRLSKNAA